MASQETDPAIAGSDELVYGATTPIGMKEFGDVFRERMMGTLRNWTESRREFPQELDCLVSSVSDLWRDLSVTDSTKFSRFLFALIKQQIVRIGAKNVRVIDNEDELATSLSEFLAGIRTVEDLLSNPFNLFSPDFVWRRLPLVVFAPPVHPTPPFFDDLRPHWSALMRRWRDRLKKEAWKGPIPFRVAADELVQATLSSEVMHQLPKPSPEFNLYLEVELCKTWREFFVSQDYSLVLKLSDVLVHHLFNSPEPYVDWPTASSWYLGVHLFEDHGLRNPNVGGGQILAVVQLYCSADPGANPDFMMFERGLMRVYEEIGVYDEGKFNKFVMELLLNELRGNFVLKKKELTQQVLLRFRRDLPVDDGLVEAFDDAEKGHTSLEVDMVDFVFDRCILGLWDLGRKLGRPFNKEEGVLALNQVSACMETLFPFFKDFNVNVIQDIEFRSPGDWPLETLNAWSKLWRSFLTDIARGASQNIDKYRKKIAEIREFVFHPHWQPPVQEKLSAVAMQAVTEILPRLGASHFQWPYLSAAEPFLRNLEGGFALFAATDGPWAEALRDPHSLRTSAGLLMPNIDVLVDETRKLFWEQVRGHPFRDKKHLVNVFKRHMAHWKLLLKTGAIKKVEVALLLSLVEDLKPWSRDTILFEAEEMISQIVLSDGVIFESLASDLSQLLAHVVDNADLRLLLAEISLQTFARPPLFGLPVEALASVVGRLGDCTNSDLAKSDTPPAGVNRSEDISLGLSVRGEPSEFLVEFLAIMKRFTAYLTSQQRQNPLAEEGHVVLGASLGEIVFYPLQSLYARFLARQTDAERWPRFLRDSISKVLAELAPSLTQAQMQVFTEANTQVFTECLLLGLVRPPMYSASLRRLWTLLPCFSTVEILLHDVVELMVHALDTIGSDFLSEVGVARIIKALSWSEEENVQAQLLVEWRRRCCAYLDPSSTHPLTYWIKRIEMLISFGGLTSEYISSKQICGEPEIEKTSAPSAPVALNGFQGPRVVIEELSASLGIFWRAVIDSLDTSQTLPFHDTLALVAEGQRIIDASQLTIANHSGFVALVRKEITSCVARKFPDPSDSVSAGLSVLIVSIGIDNKKSKQKAITNARDSLSQWFDVTPQTAEPNSLPIDIASPAGSNLLTVTAEVPARSSAPVKSIEHQSLEPIDVVIQDEVSGLAGRPDRIVIFKEVLHKHLTFGFERMAQVLQQKGNLSVNQLDDLRESFLVELFDSTVKVERRTQWRKYLVSELAVSARALFPSGVEWAIPMICNILTSETGSDQNTALARRVLIEDKRSPFSKASVTKQNDGMYKFRAEVDEDAEWNGLFLPEEKICELGDRIHEAIRWLASELKSRKDDYQPKSFLLVEAFSDSIEGARFSAEAVVQDVSKIHQFLESALVHEGVDAWHASSIARFACSQFFDSAEGAKEKAELKELILNDRQSDFSVDPYVGWRPVVTDSRLEVPQFPRVSYPASGLSLQSAHHNDQSFMLVLEGIFSDHVRKWHRQPKPLPWSLIDSLVRDLRAEAFKHLLVVEDCAVLALCLDSKVFATISLQQLVLGSARDPGVVRSLLSEYLAEMLRFRPDARVVFSVKAKMLSFDELFSAIEASVPRPVGGGLGFTVNSNEPVFESERRVVGAIESYMTSYVASRATEDTNQVATDSQWESNFRLLVERERVRVFDDEAFRRFLRPIVGLAFRSIASNEEMDSLAVNLASLAGDSTALNALDPASPDNSQTSEAPPRVFDGTKPEIYLEWRYGVLSKISLSDLCSGAAGQILLEAVNVPGLTQPNWTFLDTLTYLNDRFDCGIARKYILNQIKCELTEARRRRLLEIKARFIRETGERQSIREFVHRLLTEDERDLGLAMYGFGDVKLAVFRARLKVFTESLGR